MKITTRRLSIPPYISCSWDQISSLHVDEKEIERDLVVFMASGARIVIPHLSETIIETIFQAHGEHLDQGDNAMKGAIQIEGLGPGMIALPGNIANMSSLAELMQHNSAHKDMPPLSSEMLGRVIGIVKMIAPDELHNLPAAEPHCNCMHCQISRTVESEALIAADEEVVGDEELNFRSWDIDAEGEKLYLVRNPLDKSEEYHVFLGDPLGCTCGSKNCVHIEAVLRS